MAPANIHFIGRWANDIRDRQRFSQFGRQGFRPFNPTRLPLLLITSIAE
jgi:hypothetical protein